MLNSQALATQSRGPDLGAVQAFNHTAVLGQGTGGSLGLAGWWHSSECSERQFLESKWIEDTLEPSHTHLHRHAYVTERASFLYSDHHS